MALSVKELGFNDGAYYKDICTKALELGLELCPAEVGPALRLVYKDQSRGEWLRIAMEAITGSDGAASSSRSTSTTGCGSTATMGIPSSFGKLTAASCSCVEKPKQFRYIMKILNLRCFKRR